MTVLLRIDEPASQRPPPGRGFALWALGFRPFYLLASGFAALSILLWALQFGGWLDAAYLRGPVWHAHEMLFGYTLAVVVGFLFTAGQNWSGQPTPKGGLLMALALLWLAGRVLVVTPWAMAAALVNLAFPLAAAAALARALVAGGNRRNYFFVGLLLMLGLAQAVVHAVQMNLLVLPAGFGAQAALQLALDVVLFIMAVMGGRVIPMFTNNSVPGAQARRLPWVEKASLGSVLALIAADLLLPRGPWTAPLLIALLGVAMLAHGARLWLWQPLVTRHTPLVWVLHAAYAWIPLHLGLRALAEAGWVASSPATHALTAGAIGALTLGMMTRTARGHTAQPLRADRWDTLSYAAVLGAALLRVAGPLLQAQWLLPAVLASALLWSLAFAIYFWRYFPLLTRPRADGRPG
ncbi:MAG: NnrS family protein [Burkholderiales bacterium]|nr:NnrS family protein [Burkholderiales bacterium]